MNNATRKLLEAAALIGLMTINAGSVKATAGQFVEKATVSLPAPPQSLDPTRTVTASDRAIFSLTNGTLFRTETDGKIVPSLAESITYNTDFSEADVKLKSGLKFSDGSSLTAADVAATFKRHKEEKGSVLGALMNRIETVEAKDDLTAHFKFTGPFPSFGDFSSAGSYGIYPAAGLAKGDDFFVEPVTSGPYRFTSTWASNKISMTANENYGGGPKPAIGNITLTIIEDANSAVSQLQSGQVDYAGDLPPSFMRQLNGAQGITTSAIPVYGFYDLRMWNQTGPFADPNMRNAVSAALNRQAIVRAIWGDVNQPQSGFWPPTMAFHDPKQSTTADLAAAKAYLAKTNCANGCKIRLMYSDQDFAFSSQLALMVQNQLKQIGISVQIERLDAPTLIQRLRAGDYDLAPGAMAASANIPDQLLGNALLGTGPLKAEFTGYNSDEMNKLVDAVDRSSGEERAAAAKKLGDLFNTDRPYAVLAPWVRGAASRLAPDVISLQGTGIVVGGVTP
jgi:peptide/nickel transport system substrate-binding protein